MSEKQYFKRINNRKNLRKNSKLTISDMICNYLAYEFIVFGLQKYK